MAGVPVLSRVLRIDGSALAFAPASNVSATTRVLVGMRVQSVPSRPAGLAGDGATGGGGWVVTGRGVLLGAGAGVGVGVGVGVGADGGLGVGAWDGVGGTEGDGDVEGKGSPLGDLLESAPLPPGAHDVAHRNAAATSATLRCLATL